MNETIYHQPLTTGRRPGAARLAGLVLGAATVAMGLIAGFFFDWAVAIMPALTKADDRTFVTVMLDLITTINNSPLFLLAFTGALLLTVAAAILHTTGDRPAARQDFESPWTTAHLFRTLAATAALATLCRALHLHRSAA